MNAWKFGGPGLRRPLEKLLATWTGVFPYPVLDEIRAAMATTPAAYGLTTVSNGHPVYAAPSGGAAGRKPMTLDPRLSGAYAHSLGSHPAYPPPAAGMYDQGQGFVGYPAHVSTSGYEVQPANHPLPMQPLQGPQSTANLPDLLALLSSGPLTSAGVQPTVPDVGTIRQLKGKSRMSTTVFSNENIKVYTQIDLITFCFCGINSVSFMFINRFLKLAFALLLSILWTCLNCISGPGPSLLVEKHAP